MNARLSIALLSLSAVAWGAIATHESYTTKAVIPTKNDRPTVGFGSTFKEDGSAVKLGESITPVQAVNRSLAHIAKDEAGLKRCVTGQMSQAEYDILVDFTYQYGTVAACKSAMVRSINTGQYAQACKGYTLYKYSGGFDCSIPGNRVCAGVWTRNLERQTKCLESQ
jgi:lysozyme